MTEKNEDAENEKFNMKKLDPRNLKVHHIKENLVALLVIIAILGAVTWALVLSPSIMGQATNPLSNESTQNYSEPTEKINDGDIVVMGYTLRLENDTIVETSYEEVAKEEGIYNPEAKYEPLEFSLGKNEIITPIEEAVSKMDLNETKEVKVEDPYGPKENTQQVNIDNLKSGLGIEEVEEGETYPYQGTTLTVNQVNDDGTAQITIVNPHPLAGKTTYFTITVEEVKGPYENIEKKEVPEVELFAMSYCPYGTQMEKAILPVQELLGDKANIQVKFVDYVMHGEKEIMENTRHYCIQNNQQNKFWNYLECFLEDSETDKCLQETEIDQTKLESCVNEEIEKHNLLNGTGNYPPYPLQTELNEEYGVEGSPTFVVNGETLDVSRTPEDVKEVVCAAFTEKPSECEQTLSTESPSAGFGFSGSGTDSGSCG